MNERTKNTIEFLRDRADLFDRFTSDGRGGRVRWNQRMPRGYDNKKCLPWGSVRGRYWYPWK
ncbi:MAG: hypothetical protein KatS3mg051_1095 [Anaerolineae bacterium]|nr:MAG: hypothetical protein KatS3mg051_1095 [Anaerolineae bacterium]